MSESNVRIVKLEPMRVAGFHAYGETPENDAAGKLVVWAKPRGFLDTPEGYRIFGFNNPDPSPGSPNYGYEFWITIGQDIQSTEDVNIKEFTGGLYAVARCEVKDNPYEVIPATWQQLVEWCENSSEYSGANHQWLEEHIGPFPFDVSGDFALDLYLPIKK